MGILGQIILGLLMVAGGVALLKYNYQVANSIHLRVIEDHLGSGSGYLIWKVISVLVILAGFTVIFGFHDDILGWILSPLTNLFRRAQ